MTQVDVHQMGKARENRKKRQLQILKDYNNPLISFTLNIPGPVKDNPQFRKISKKGIFLIENCFRDNMIFKEIITLNTGSEAYFSINLTAEKIKNRTITIEDGSALGRIFDIDVIDIDGKSLSRRELNLEPRKCLLCDEEASLCSRSRKHSVDELITEINRLAEVSL